jgi:hypothetical protein
LWGLAPVRTPFLPFFFVGAPTPVPHFATQIGVGQQDERGAAQKWSESHSVPIGHGFPVGHEATQNPPAPQHVLIAQKYPLGQSLELSHVGVP